MERKWSLFDTVLLVILILAYVPLSLWGGSQEWAGATDGLPLILFGIGAVYVILESIRLCSPAVCPVLAAIVPLLAIGPSLFVYPADVGPLAPTVAVGYLFGLVVSSVCWRVKKRTVAPISSWAFWLGIHSIFLCLLAVPAVICGHIALARLPATETAKRGRVKIGLFIGYPVLVVMILALALITGNVTV